MTHASDIIIYGASGYTGKLIAESLHNRGIAFTAAGRTEEKLHKALDVVAGRADVENISAKVATAQHTEESLVALFTGAKVVVNVTGPFSEIGEVVVKSALQAGCHYLDTTGEQDFMLDMKEKYGTAFAEKDLLLSPACSYMWTLGGLAAEVTLEDDAIDSLEIAYTSDQGVPSVASSQSFMRMLAAPHFYLKNNELTPWELGRTFDVVIPGKTQVFKGSAWGGAGEPAWYAEDQRVRNCRVYNCAEDNDTMEMLSGIIKQIVEGSEGNFEAGQAAAIQTAGDFFQSEPEKENPLVHRGLVHCAGNGSTARSSCTISFHSPYVMTGELIAECSRLLLEGSPSAVGFASPAAAFGHRELLKMLADQGFLIVNEE
jgi:hypothetical protein